MAENQRETSWLEHLPSLPAVIAVLGVVAYAALRYAYSRFYSPLGVLPEEVGIGYAQVLAYAGPSLFLLLLGCGLIAAALYLVRWLVKRGGPQTKDDEGELAEVIREAIAQDPSAAEPKDETARRIESVYGNPARERLVATTVEEWRATIRKKEDRRHLVAMLVLIVYAALALGAAVIWIGAQANARSRDALAGRRVAPISIFGLDVVSLRAVPAFVHSADKAPESLAQYDEECVLYLGAADGTVVFVAESDIVLRVPDSSVVFEASVTTQSCGEAEM